ncbi:MAG: hypothetical protein KGJ02_05405 [Verrucomicrobiota bacterium]|nr:hypothetical protein [Verrucomicrobiota bacterium]
MNMKKNKFTEKMKENIPVEEIERFTRRYATEVFSAGALIVGAISSLAHFFSGPGWTLFFAALGAILGIFFPEQVDRLLKWLYNFSFMQRKTAQTIVGIFEVAIGFFLPFAIYGLLGLLAGSAYHYYTRHAQKSSP